MKRMIAILLAVLTMTAILAGCNTRTNGYGSNTNGGYGQSAPYTNDGYVPSDAYANDGYGSYSNGGMYNNAPAGQNGTGNFGRDMDRAMDEAGNAVGDAGRAVGDVGRAVGDAIGGNNAGTGMAGGQ